MQKVINATIKYTIAANKKPNLSKAQNDAIKELTAETDVGVSNIINKLVFSITSKIPVKNGANVK